MQLLAMFPLEIVVFPQEALNLHIFEPRYRELIQDCEEQNILFGIPYYRPENKMKFGTIVQLKKVERVYDNGTMDIKTEGLDPFELMRFTKFHPGKSYPGGYIRKLYWEKEGDLNLRAKIREALKELYEFMNIKKAPVVFEDSFITFDIAHKVGFTKNQEYELLQIPSEVQRQQFMFDHLKRMIPMIKQAEEMRKKVQQNGHFRSITPPDL